MAKSTSKTPLMRQYDSIKSKYPDALLLFRVGDFYETFGADAITVANTLGIVLTKRSNGSASEVELAGFPFHALDTYLPKLVRAGFRVAICEQLEDPSQTKTLVKRGVTELITPGLALSDKILDHKSNNYLAAIYASSKQWGIAFVDISTGEFLTAQGDFLYIEKLLQSFSPSEILIPKNKQTQYKEKFGEQYYFYALDDWAFQYDYAYETLLKHFKSKSLKGFGLEEDYQEGIHAAGVIIHYLALTQHDRLEHISALRPIAQEKYVWLDRFTIRNLELIGSQHPQGVSLLQVLDKTLTPMGARLMKKWILLPLKDIAAIQNRQQVIGFFIEKKEVRDKIASYLREIGDLERLIAKVPMGKINPRELLQLRRALNCIAPLQKLCAASACAPLQQLAEQLNPCNSVSERIAKEIQEDAPAIVSKGDVIKNGVSETLDELRSIAFSSKEYLLQIQQREIANTGIQSLKIGFNNVFGYYIEVTNRYREQVPEAWQRKQTLANAERYITEELKTYEAKILQAQEKIIPLEEELFNNLVNALGEYVKPIQHNAQLLARLDCLYALANVSENNQYTCPELDESFCIDIKNGRHPVIEQSLKTGEAYVPNDLYLDTESQQIIIITGPNMSGKSALLRQTALIVLLAQMGCYVPAEKATLGITDKIFTRVGASDNLSLGESTFMVEMNETANIMNNLSARSLVLLDEIGRGTSTFDGISIAWALAEYLHNQPDIRPKTLFATHYHELNDLADKHARIKNFHVATHELADKVVFLRKLKEGGSEHSFGIHVARMAAMPPQIIDRAETILATLEEKNLARPATRERLEKIPVNNYQLNLFAADYPKEWKQALALLAKIEINALTPIDALMKLHELKQILTDEKNG